MSKRQAGPTPDGETDVTSSVKDLAPGARPIRLRGFYRAVKRGDKWATDIWSKRDTDPFGYLFDLVYRNFDMAGLIYNTNPFLEMLKSDNSFMGAYFPVPIVYEEKEE